MIAHILPRTLWYQEGREVMRVGNLFLRADPRSQVVLGEAGMGKSTLLLDLEGEPGYAVCTARALINHPDPAALLGDATTFVVDALDEVSARREGDAVDLVVRRLGKLRRPRFILSCRVADWRSATGLQGLADIYGAEPVELHLEPLERWEAVSFLAVRLGGDAAEATVAHLEERGLAGLWSNPQTLELLLEVAADRKLPTSKGDLFTEATGLLRREHREIKADTSLVAMPEEEVLDAAGAAFAALIMTGKEALSRRSKLAADDIGVAEASALSGAGRLANILASRLFAAKGAERFIYVHRAVGEFLGARWLAKQADTDRKRRRLAELFGEGDLVPASLRGLHAWLAWHSPELAGAVIRTDPMGVVEYGDADRLTVGQAREMLEALVALSRENPRFRAWKRYRLGGLAQGTLEPEILEILTAPDVEFGLRLLVLQSLEGSDLAPRLRDTLLSLLMDGGAVLAIRSEAGDRLTALGEARNWIEVVIRLLDQGGDNDVDLAIKLMDELGYARFDNRLMVRALLAQLKRAEHSTGMLHRVENRLPDERLDDILDGLAAAATSEESIGDDRRGRSSLADLVYKLLARRLALGEVDPHRVWSWLKPLGEMSGYSRGREDKVAAAFQADQQLRRALQRLALLEETDKQNLLQRLWRLNEKSAGLVINDGDALALLDMLPMGDPGWREVVQLVQHSPENGAEMRAAAARFAAGNPEAETWLVELALPRVYRWQIEQEKEKRRRDEQRKREWEEHRVEFTKHLEQVRAGEYGFVINPAKAYLHLFRDMGDVATDGPGRLLEWLGTEIQLACLEGFEAFLVRKPPVPRATEMAQSHAEGKRWEAAYILIAALAERLRTGSGFEDLDNERLVAGLIETTQTRIDDHAGVAGLNKALAAVLRERDAWVAAQRMMLEPQLAHGNTHVQALYSLMHDDQDAELAMALASEWLERYPDMAGEPEAELIDRLLASGNADRLREILDARRPGLADINDERRRNWIAVGLIVDFKRISAELEARGGVEREILWNLRARLGNRRQQRSTTALDAQQLVWVIGIFRTMHPHSQRPYTVTTGDTNPWDATEYISVLIERLGDLTSAEAGANLAALRDAPLDGYTDLLRTAAAEQRRKRAEENWKAPNLATVVAVIDDLPPTTPAQLQIVVLERLDEVQAQLVGSDVDWYHDFISAEGPKPEEKCRDAILKMMRPMPFGIQVSPEGHLADDKRCDILCQLRNMIVPIEVKGQWHPDLWRAADRQLDLLYTNDWRAERGIYLVLWFGLESDKLPRKPPAGMPPPHTAHELRAALTVSSSTVRDGRTAVVALDLTRPV